MKVSVSLPTRTWTSWTPTPTRRASPRVRLWLHKAVRLLRASELGPAYEDAWEEWSRGEADAWESTVSDGLS